MFTSLTYYTLDEILMTSPSLLSRDYSSRESQSIMLVLLDLTNTVGCI